MKFRIVCSSKHSIPFNVFFLNKNTEFLKLHAICSGTKSVLIYTIQFILVPPRFRLVPHFVCSGNSTGYDTALLETTFHLEVLGKRLLTEHKLSCHHEKNL